MSSENTKVTEPQDEFELIRELDKGVWIATKKGDPQREQFLARRIDAFDSLHQATKQGHDLSKKDREAMGYKDLLYEHGQATAISRILNHENIVSLAGTIHRKPFVPADAKEDAPSEDYLVWDFCDASNLSAIFLDRPPQSGLGHYYLPESLCWHVLVSLVRAVSWLHDGVRQDVPKAMPFDGGARRKAVERYFLPSQPYSTERDWLSILHRDIRPTNIWFQHPRGIEMYGQCKLGNFSKAAVVAREGTKELKTSGERQYGYSITKREGWEPLATSYSKFYSDPELDKPEDRIYTIEDEYVSIGIVIFTMMTAEPLSRTCEKCGCCHWSDCTEPCCTKRICGCPKGGCPHIQEKSPCPGKSAWRECTHACPVPRRNISDHLRRTEYSHYLIDMVRTLLQGVDPKARKAEVSKGLCLWTVENMYESWKEETGEGFEYRDVFDDVRRRADLVKAAAGEDSGGN